MSISTIVLYIMAVITLIISLIRDRKKSLMGIKKGFLAFKKIIPLLVPLFLIVGIVLTYVTPEMIKSVLGEDSGWLGVLLGSIMGSIAFMPPFVTFPLGADLLSSGAGYAQVAAFVTTLMGVGFVYLQAETKFFGKKATLTRNVLAFVTAIIVALVITWAFLPEINL